MSWAPDFRLIGDVPPPGSEYDFRGRRMKRLRPEKAAHSRDAHMSKAARTHAVNDGKVNGLKEHRGECHPPTHEPKD